MKTAILDYKPECHNPLVITADREWLPPCNDQDLGCLKALSRGPCDKKIFWLMGPETAEFHDTTSVVEGSAGDETVFKHFLSTQQPWNVVKNKGRTKLNIEPQCWVNAPYLPQHLQVVKQNAFLISCTSYPISPHPHPSEELISHSSDTTILRKWPMDQGDWKIAPVGCILDVHYLYLNIYIAV